MKAKTFRHFRGGGLIFRPGSIQVVNLLIAGGLGFLLVGYYINFDDYGLTLNFAHRLLLTFTMLTLIVTAVRHNSKSVFWLNVVLAVFYIFSFLVGVLFGFPVLVNSYLFRADEMFSITVPRILDLGLLDFYFHGLMGFAYAICAVFWHILYRSPQSPSSGNPN